MNSEANATDRLFVGVLGNRNSGKSTTWNTLFPNTGKSTRTGVNERKLQLLDGRSANVFLINGSPEETKKHITELIGNCRPRIILCSMQYTEKVSDTVDFITDPQQCFQIMIQWLNPGKTDKGRYFDHLGLTPPLLVKEATLSMRNGKQNPKNRVKEIREYIHGWATARSLTF